MFFKEITYRHASYFQAKIQNTVDSSDLKVFCQQISQVALS